MGSSICLTLRCEMEIVAVLTFLAPVPLGLLHLLLSALKRLLIIFDHFLDERIDFSIPYHNGIPHV